MSDDHPDKLEKLFDAYFDGEISPAEFAQLEAAICTGPEVLRRFTRRAMLHNCIEQQFILSAPDDDSASSADASLSAPRQTAKTTLRETALRVAKSITRPTPLSMTTAALVIGVMVTAMAFVAMPVYRGLRGLEAERETAPVVVAQVTGEHEAQWAEGQIGGRFGAFLTADRRLHLVAGKAELTFRSGAKVLLEGPCEFSVNSAEKGTLASGKLVVRATAEARGFAIETPTSIVTDLGTEFGVEVDVGGNTNVEVFEGSVTAQVVGSTSSPMVLRSGEAAHIDAAVGIRRFASEHALAFQRGLYGAEPDLSGLVRNGSFEAAKLTTPSPFPGVYDLKVKGNALAGWSLHGMGNWIMCDAPNQTHGSPSDGTTFLNVTGPHPSYGNQQFLISQRIVTQPGKTYVVQFDLAARPGVTDRESLKVSAGDDSHEYFARDLPPATNRPASYAARSFTFVAASSATTIRIEGPTAPMNGFYFDNIRVDEHDPKVAVPAATP